MIDPNEKTLSAPSEEARDLFYEMLAARATCRNFLPDSIPEDVMNRILNAGCSAPSGGGFQNWAVIQVTKPEIREKLVNFSRGQKFIATAPISLIFCVDFWRMSQIIALEPGPMRETERLRNFSMAVTDASIAAQTVALAAQAEGLASCYIGNILNVSDQVSSLLELPEQVFPVVMLTIGYPKLRTRQPPKYSAEILVHPETYQKRNPQLLYEAYRTQNRNQKIPAHPERVEQICAAAEKQHGTAYAALVREDIAKKGYIGPYQYWLGCYYLEEPDFMSRDDEVQFFRDKGFTWI